MDNSDCDISLLTQRVFLYLCIYPPTKLVVVPIHRSHLIRLMIDWLMIDSLSKFMPFNTREIAIKCWLLLGSKFHRTPWIDGRTNLFITQRQCWLLIECMYIHSFQEGNSQKRASVNPWTYVEAGKPDVHSIITHPIPLSYLEFGDNDLRPGQNSCLLSLSILVSIQVRQFKMNSFCYN